jgi:ribosomal protein S18 acetylase RimI-like enzyme
VRIRRAGPKDASSIADVYVRSWKGAYPGLIPQSYLDALSAQECVGAWDETLATSTWPRRGVIVLLGPVEPDTGHEGPITGFVSFGPTRDEDHGTGPDAGTVGEIVTFYLDPTAFGSGGADLLMSAALVALRAADFTTAMLWVLGTNTRARRFYERRGWRPDGTTKVHDWGAFVATDERYVIDVTAEQGTPT